MTYIAVNAEGVTVGATQDAAAAAAWYARMVWRDASVAWDIETLKEGNTLGNGGRDGRPYVGIQF